ncbi:hypothetical protein ElyMa_000016100 [Elysia marginata]|uniref:Uncharacterized protein n=1 Tax=Elysia marginata TaxID=1093978 RepID=A0AAV4EBD2_9GAST|nr:hypothetical protein ElyMa_000016100 [Elysia marginata]
MTQDNKLHDLIILNYAVLSLPAMRELLQWTQIIADWKLRHSRDFSSFVRLECAALKKRTTWADRSLNLSSRPQFIANSLRCQLKEIEERVRNGAIAR